VDLPRSGLKPGLRPPSPGFGAPAFPCQQQAEKSLLKVCLAGFLPLVILDLVLSSPLGYGACQVEVTPLSLCGVSDSEREDGAGGGGGGRVLLKSPS